VGYSHEETLHFPSDTHATEAFICALATLARDAKQNTKGRTILHIFIFPMGDLPEELGDLPEELGDLPH